MLSSFNPSVTTDSFITFKSVTVSILTLYLISNTADDAAFFFGSITFYELLGLILNNVLGAYYYYYCYTIIKGLRGVSFDPYSLISTDYLSCLLIKSLFFKLDQLLLVAKEGVDWPSLSDARILRHYTLLWIFYLFSFYLSAEVSSKLDLIIELALRQSSLRRDVLDVEHIDRDEGLLTILISVSI